MLILQKVIYEWKDFATMEMSSNVNEVEKILSASVWSLSNNVKYIQANGTEENTLAYKPCYSP